MNLVRCGAGHYYDGDKYASCPHCAKKGEDVKTTEPIDVHKVDSMIMCPKGHYYDSKQYSSCPYCEQGGEGQDTTVPLSDSIGPGRNTVIVNEDATISLSMTKKGTEPVVGWLVCINGEDEGKGFPLKANKNFIGRSSASDVALKGDNSVSREKHAVVIYEPQQRMFIAQPGDARALYYLNGKVVLNNEVLKPYDILEIGKTKLLFQPL